MSNAKAISKYIRISPRKARLAAGLIPAGTLVSEAIKRLMFCNLKAGPLLKKTLDSAVANAETQLKARSEKLKIAEVRIDEGPTLKRSKPKNRGGQHPIMKRTSHFTVIVSQL
ncbi:MAG: 50S ribosomal protein L22 [Parachlamydiaceae bacterium]|nr:50S ribosomal protein L22 [Parachlamydiaceae bacterium]